MTLRVIHLTMLQSSVGKFINELIKLLWVDFAGMVFKDSFNAMPAQSKRQRMKIANIRHDQLIALSHIRIEQRAEYRRRRGIHQQHFTVEVNSFLNGA